MQSGTDATFHGFEMDFAERDAACRHFCEQPTTITCDRKWTLRDNRDQSTAFIAGQRMCRRNWIDIGLIAHRACKTFWNVVIDKPSNWRAACLLGELFELLVGLFKCESWYPVDNEMSRSISNTFGGEVARDIQYAWTGHTEVSQQCAVGETLQPLACS